ncbi:hypothetical protein B5V02_00155 [Mesorhizobium kowhaii]|uniref:Uncharacterized protein n=1 Tax=Mesorhizobium kowhaii TaxID=1300272 RepID=A0A2W7CBY5_9HYPH|nr:hypothetical protein B5V02_00155 [Mesorhizobium kowhaii]
MLAAARDVITPSLAGLRAHNAFADHCGSLTAEAKAAIRPSIDERVAASDGIVNTPAPALQH